jgi:hypothetical protein
MLNYYRSKHWKEICLLSEKWYYFK